MLNPFEQLKNVHPSPEHCFEEVASVILRTSIADAKRVRVHRGDEGVDTFTGTWGNGGELDVYQIKFFTTQWGDSQKQQIRESFQRSSENKNYNLRKWFLVLPTNPTANDYKWFYEWRKNQTREIDIIDGAAMSDKLALSECAEARRLLKGWGVQGLSSGVLLVPSVTISSRESLVAIPFLRLTNKGDKTARNVRLIVLHAETHTVANRHHEGWWRDTGNGVLNPRLLESVKAINPEDNVPVFAMPLQAIPSADFFIKIKITAEDTAPNEVICILSPDDLRSRQSQQFAPVTSAAANVSSAADSPRYSQFTKEIVALFESMPELQEPALHFITKQIPGATGQHAFFVGELSATGSRAHLVKTDLLKAAIGELLESGRLKQAIEAPNRLVYEFVR